MPAYSTNNVLRLLGLHIGEVNLAIVYSGGDSSLLSDKSPTAIKRDSLQRTARFAGGRKKQTNKETKKTEGKENQFNLRIKRYCEYNELHFARNGHTKNITH